jgi:hypothetical protein
VKPTCSGCVFFDRGQDERGWCHRFPPKPATITQFPQDMYGEDHAPYVRYVTTFPHVSNEAWCGEFKPRWRRWFLR